MKRLSSFIAIVIILSGCAETAHVVKDSSTNMARYKTYAWVPTTVPKDAKPNHDNELVEQNIRNSVSEQLQKRGYTETAVARICS